MTHFSLMQKVYYVIASSRMDTKAKIIVCTVYKVGNKYVYLKSATRSSDYIKLDKSQNTIFSSLDKAEEYVKNNGFNEQYILE